MEHIGFFTSIPIEVIFATEKYRPVDLNNILMADSDPNLLISNEEEDGFPRNYCAWLKGIMGVIKSKGIKKIITVREGECTGSEKLIELLASSNVECIPFSYPYDKNENKMKIEIERLLSYFSVSWLEAEKVRERINMLREKVFEIDRKSHVDLNVTSEENYVSLLQCSDFCGDISASHTAIEKVFQNILKRKSGLFGDKIKVGVIGIPPIVNNLFQVIESCNGIVIFNEMPRQFAMTGFRKSLIKQYLEFTYPYSIEDRIKDIQTAITERKLEGIIHYVQSFCPRQIDDVLLRKNCEVPFLTIECDKPGYLDERNITRIEAFFEQLKLLK